MAAVEEEASPEANDASLLTIVLDTSPRHWSTTPGAGGDGDGDDRIRFAGVLTAITVLVKAFRMLHSDNQLAVVCCDDRGRYAARARAGGCWRVCVACCGRRLYCDGGWDVCGEMWPTPSRKLPAEVSCGVYRHRLACAHRVDLNTFCAFTRFLLAPPSPLPPSSVPSFLVLPRTHMHMWTHILTHIHSRTHTHYARTTSRAATLCTRPMPAASSTRPG